MLSEPSSPLWQSWEVDFHAPRFRFYGYCAPSLGRTAGSDYSAIITLAKHKVSGYMYVMDKERQLRRETGRGYTLFGAEPGTPEGGPSLSVPAGAIPAPFAP